MGLNRFDKEATIMTSLRKSTIRVTTVLVAICVLQVYVIGRGSRPIGSDAAAANANLSQLILGRLTIGEDRFILVNGNSANSGTTVFSGSELQTPEGVDALVQLGTASLYLQANTDLTVTFDKESVDVKIASGNAFVTAPPEVRYSITAPDGTTSTGTTGAVPPAPGKWSNKKKAAVIIPIVLAAIFIPLCIAKCGGNESTIR
jgi:hypothetical protein